jgi:hypothetical protein
MPESGHSHLSTAYIFCLKHFNLLRIYVKDTITILSSSRKVFVWVRSVSIVSEYRLDDRGSIPGRGKGLFL